jgi:ubiquinone/menaquinone biosynthesis C-methylase UbiE
MSYLRLGHLIGTLGFVPKSILDIGYGNGDFLVACKNIIPKCYGSDISEYPIPNGCKFIEDPSSKIVDVATFYDSLEHFPNL